MSQFCSSRLSKCVGRLLSINTRPFPRSSPFITVLRCRLAAVEKTSTFFNYLCVFTFFTFCVTLLEQNVENLDTLWVYVSTCRSSKTVVVLFFVPIFPTLMSKKFSESCFLFPLSQNAISCIEEYRLRMSRLFSIVGDSNVRRN